MNKGTFDHIVIGAGSAGARGAARLGAMLGLPCLLLALAACETVTDGAPYEPDASMGMLIARDSCSECHQTGRTGESPNSHALPFREIVNLPGMTPEALTGWLQDGHNYPAEMGFHLEPHRVDSLVAYMIRLQSSEAPSES